MRKIPPLILLLFLSGIVPTIYAEDPETIVYRGDSYIDIDYGDGTHSWESAPLWIYNGSQYIPYLFQDNYASDGFYQVQSGLIGARIYDYYAKFYSPDMGEVRLYDERWEIQRWTGSKWSDIGAQSGAPTFLVSQGETGVNITKSFTSWAGTLDIIYIFREGQPLKHTIYFNSILVGDTTYQVEQKWAGIVASKVTHDNGEDVITSANTVNSSKFKFLREDGGLSILENQRKMYYGWNEAEQDYYILENQNIRPVEIDVHAQGLKADFTFSNWTLSQGETLEIDPDTSTLNDPTEDGDITLLGGYNRDNSDTKLVIRYNIGTGATIRAYVDWDISSIPDTAKITDTVFKYEGLQYEGDCHIHERNVEYTGSDADLYGDIGAGTIYADPDGFPVVSADEEVDLGNEADADLEAQLGDDWFGIGIQKDDEGSDGKIWVASEEDGGATPKPTLYVEYSIGVEYERFLSQSLSISSDSYRTWDLSRTFSLGLTTSISADKTWELIRTASQIITTSFNGNRVFFAVRDVAQSLTTTLSGVRVWSAIREVSQILTINLNVERILSAVRTASQNLMTSLSVNRVWETRRTPSQSLITSFYSGRNWTLKRIATQAINFVSAVSAVLNGGGELFKRCVSVSLNFASNALGALRMWLLSLVVTDMDEIPLWNATVSIMSQNPGLVYLGKTFENGTIAPLYLKPGDYDMEISKLYYLTEGITHPLTSNVSLSISLEGKIEEGAMVINSLTVPISLTALAFTILLYYPKITKKTSEPNAILAMVAMIAWLISAMMTLHNDPDTWPIALFYGGLSLACFFDVIQGTFFMDEEQDDWDLRR